MGEPAVRIQFEGAFDSRLRAQVIALKIQRPGAYGVRPGIVCVEQDGRFRAGLCILVQPGKNLHASHGNVHRVISWVGADGLLVKINGLEQFSLREEGFRLGHKGLGERVAVAVGTNGGGMFGTITRST